MNIYHVTSMNVECMCVQVSPGVLGPHIPDLVKVLLQCFRDDSWLVRDGGCILLSLTTCYSTDTAITITLYRTPQLVCVCVCVCVSVCVFV